MKRRAFLATAGAAVVGWLSGGGAAAAAEAVGPGKSRVVRVRRPQLFAHGEIPARATAEMVHAAVKALAGETDGAAAWHRFIKPEDLVGIKINSLFGPGASTHLEVIEAVIAGCQAAGVPPERIIVWDRSTAELSRAGYPVGRDGRGVKWLGTDRDYEPQPTVAGSFKGRLSRLLTQRITALINVPVLKTHNVAGLTLALKNHYGSFHNPADHHANGCDPYLADLNGLAVIRGKTRLIIADALFPIAEGGPQARPQYTWPYGAILAATDPVALDFVGLQILEARRRTLGLEPIGRRVRYLATAAARGLGTNDPRRIEIVDLA
jgi:uncharacterized protein (DUF362 family)